MEINNSLNTDEIVLSDTDVPFSDERQLKIHQLNAELEAQKEKNQQIKEDRQMRKEYAAKSYFFARYTLLAWGALVFLYILVPEKSKLMSVEMFGIITSACTINILVAFHAVIKGLFPSKKD